MSSPTMDSRAEALVLTAGTVGPVARRILDNRAEGRVVAVFRSAFYIGFGARMTCVGTGALEPGPITLVTSAPAPLDWRDLGLRQNQRAVLSAGGLRVGPALGVSLRDAADWAPPRTAGAACPDAATRGLAAFRAAVADRSPDDGLGHFIAPNGEAAPRNREGRAAEAPVAAARRWLARAMTPAMPAGAGDLAWVDALVGLGPGLTPSGDDFLGGLMIALHRLDHAAPARLLWSRVRRAGGATNPISLALLQAASEGLGGASLHRALEAILQGDGPSVRAAVPGIDAIGHSSGWDAMAGIATALDGWLAAPPMARAAEAPGHDLIRL